MNMQLYYEYENINLKLNRMNQTELNSDYADELIGRLDDICKAIEADDVEGE